MVQKEQTPTAEEADGSQPQNLAELFHQTDQGIERRRTDNLFKQLDERALTKDEERIIEQRVAMQRKLLQEYERREKIRKVQELMEICPDLDEEDAEAALDLCRGSEEEAAFNLSSDASFKRRVFIQSGKITSVSNSTKPRGNNWSARPSGKAPKLIKPSTVEGGVFVGKFQGRLGSYQQKSVPSTKSDVQQDDKQPEAEPGAGELNDAEAKGVKGRRSGRTRRVGSFDKLSNALSSPAQGEKDKVGAAYCNGEEKTVEPALEKKETGDTSMEDVEGTEEEDAEAVDGGADDDDDEEEENENKEGDEDSEQVQGDGEEGVAQEIEAQPAATEGPRSSRADALLVRKLASQVSMNMGAALKRLSALSNDMVARVLNLMADVYPEEASKLSTSWEVQKAAAAAGMDLEETGAMDFEDIPSPFTSAKKTKSRTAMSGGSPLAVRAMCSKEEVDDTMDKAGQKADKTETSNQPQPASPSGTPSVRRSERVSSRLSLSHLRSASQPKSLPEAQADGMGEEAQKITVKEPSGAVANVSETTTITDLGSRLASSQKEDQALEDVAQAASGPVTRGKRRQPSSETVRSPKRRARGPTSTRKQSDGPMDDTPAATRKGKGFTSSIDAVKSEGQGAAEPSGKCPENEEELLAPEKENAPPESTDNGAKLPVSSSGLEEPVPVAGDTSDAKLSDKEEEASGQGTRRRTARQGRGGSGAISSSGHTCRGRVKHKGAKKAELVEAGELHAHKDWYNSGYIFPLGFKSRLLFRSSVELDALCYHECEILGPGNPYWPKPTFMVRALDRPDDPLIAASCTGCWTQVLKRINGVIEELRKQGEDIPPPPKTAIAGPEYFGLLQPEIVEAIEALDPEHECIDYWAGKQEREQAKLDLATGGRVTKGTAPKIPRPPSNPSRPKGGKKGRRKSGGGDEDGDETAGEDEEEYRGNRWSAVSRAERYRQRVTDAGEEYKPDDDNPLPGFLDPITLEEVVNPAISPYGHVMGLATWRAVLAEHGRCPFTKKNLRVEQLSVLTKCNMDKFKDRIIYQ